MLFSRSLKTKDYLGLVYLKKVKAVSPRASSVNNNEITVLFHCCSWVKSADSQLGATTRISGITVIQ